MSNTIKYANSPEENSLRVGNFNIGVGDVPKGPTEVTGHWNTIIPPNEGYTVYQNKEENGPSIYVCSNDQDLLNISNSLSENNYVENEYVSDYFEGFNDVYEAIDWFYQQEDLIVVNKNYPTIITDSLFLNIDSSYIGSYVGIGDSWKDISGNGNNATLFNNFSFNDNLYFNGTNSYAETTNIDAFGLDPFTISVWFKTDGSQTNNASIVCIANTFSPNNWQVSFTSNKLVFFTGGNLQIQTTYIPNDDWTNVVVVRNSLNTNDTHIYINGVLNVSGTSNNNFSDTSGIRVGMNRGSNAFFKGEISQILIYRKALTEAEITDNYNYYLE